VASLLDYGVKWTRREAVATKCEALSRCLPAWTEESHEKHENPDQSMFRPTLLEWGISRMEVRSAIISQMAQWLNIAYLG
jgi:hypothetical protein